MTLALTLELWVAFSSPPVPALVIAAIFVIGFGLLTLLSLLISFIVLGDLQQAAKTGRSVDADGLNLKASVNVAGKPF